MRWLFWGFLSFVLGLVLLGATMNPYDSRLTERLALFGVTVNPYDSGETERGPQLSEEQRAEQRRLRMERERNISAMVRPPMLQELFVNAVADGTNAFRSAGSSEFAQGATRPARSTAICALGIGRNPQVHEWVGTVVRRTTNSEGRGVLHVRLSDTVTLKTWNNSLSDFRDRTLVEPGSPVFQAMSQLAEGTIVRFSGSFVPSPVDCVHESSLTLRGSMTSPEFIFRFDGLRRAIVE